MQEACLTSQYLEQVGDWFVGPQGGERVPRGSGHDHGHCCKHPLSYGEKFLVTKLCFINVLSSSSLVCMYNMYTMYTNTSDFHNEQYSQQPGLYWGHHMTSYNVGEVGKEEETYRQ